MYKGKISESKLEKMASDEEEHDFAVKNPIKYSYETGKLAHLERVLMFTQALEELEVTSFKKIEGDMHRVFCHCMQQAYEHGLNSQK